MPAPFTIALGSRDPALTGTFNVQGANATSAGQNLTGYTAPAFKYRQRMGTTVTTGTGTTTVTTAATGQMKYVWAAADAQGTGLLNVAGEYLGWWEATGPDGVQASDEFPILVAAHLPGSGSLCEVWDVKDLLEAPIAEHTRDARILHDIGKASALILGWCEEEFAPASTALTRYFHYYGGGYLDLRPYSLRNLTSVTLDSDLDPSQQTVLNYARPASTTTPNDVVLMPMPAQDGVYHMLLMRTYAPLDVAGAYLPYRANTIADLPGRDTPREVAIVGDWGYAAVPAEARRACALTVATWLQRSVQAYGVADVDGDPRQMHPGLDRAYSLPPAAKALLARWRTPSVA